MTTGSQSLSREGEGEGDDDQASLHGGRPTLTTSKEGRERIAHKGGVKRDARSRQGEVVNQKIGKQFRRDGDSGGDRLQALSGARD